MRGLLQSAVGLLQLVALANAMPGPEIFKRKACHADNCLRALRGSSSAASAACSAFFTNTVSSCTTTTSVSVSTTTVTSITVVSSTAFATATSTSLTLMKRQNAGCTPTSIAAKSSVPSAFANACQTSSARFSSACKCIGISTGSGTTTVTGTATSTMVSVATSTVVTTTTAVTTGTTTTVVVSTSSTTSSTTSTTSSTSSSATTSSTSFMTTSTTTSSAPSTPSVAGFKLVVSGGRQLRTFTDGSGDVAPIQGPGGGNIYTLSTTGQVSDSTAPNNRWLLKTTTGTDQIFDQPPAAGNYIVKCSVPSSGLGAFTCVGASGAQIYFNICGQDGSNNQYLFLTTSYSVAGCAATDLQAVSPSNNP